jgi:hypothetical protein
MMDKSLNGIRTMPYRNTATSSSLSRTLTYRFAIATASVLYLANMTGCASVAKQAAPAKIDASTDASEAVAEVAAWMAGHYDSRDQSSTDATYYAISLSMVPIWPQRTDGRWLYVEQAIADTPEKPYRQRVYHISNGAEGEVLSAVFTIEEPARFVQGWRSGALDGLSESMLQSRAGCTVSLRKLGDSWRGATTGRDCASDLRGAAYATAEVTLDAASMRSWDRGYDTAGKQVWGASAGAYIFVKRAPAK